MKFHLGDILSITTGRLVSPEHMNGVYAILNHMTQDDLFTHQLPRAARECEPYLLEEMPWLNEIEAPEDLNEDTWVAWLLIQTIEHGEYHEVHPIHPEDHERLDPIEEAKRMGFDESNIIVLGGIE